MKRLGVIGLMLIVALSGWSKVHIPDSVMHSDGLYVDNMKIYNDSAIFQGINLKLDLFNTVFYLAKSKADFQTYEIALNARLKNRFYPTLELGYAKGALGSNAAIWSGYGGWTTLGLDINGLRKHLESQNALLVGVRVGTAMQQYDLTQVPTNDDYWQATPSTAYYKQFHNDWWGEVVAGCQVQVYSGLMMGWYLRLKMLFTRKTTGDAPIPYFIPGFGYRDYTQWGINYYIGWKF